MQRDTSEPAIQLLNRLIADYKASKNRLYRHRLPECREALKALKKGNPDPAAAVLLQRWEFCNMHAIRPNPDWMSWREEARLTAAALNFLGQKYTPMRMWGKRFLEEREQDVRHHIEMIDGIVHELQDRAKHVSDLHPKTKRELELAASELKANNFARAARILRWSYRQIKIADTPGLQSRQRVIVEKLISLSEVYGWHKVWKNLKPV
jgi:hypothetical protein